MNRYLRWLILSLVAPALLMSILVGMFWWIGHFEHLGMSAVDWPFTCFVGGMTWVLSLAGYVDVLHGER